MPFAIGQPRYKGIRGWLREWKKSRREGVVRSYELPNRLTGYDKYGIIKARVKNGKITGDVTLYKNRESHDRGSDFLIGNTSEFAELIVRLNQSYDFSHKIPKPESPGFSWGEPFR